MDNPLLFLPFISLNDSELINEINSNYQLPLEIFDNLIFNNSDSSSFHESANDPDYNLFNNHKPMISNYYNAIEWNSICIHNPKKLKLLFCNIASMHSNFDSFITSYFNNINSLPSIFGFSETHLTPETECLYHLENYHLFTNNTRASPWGRASSRVRP